MVVGDCGDVYVVVASPWRVVATVSGGREDEGSTIVVT